MTNATFSPEIPPEILAKIFLHTIDHLDTLLLPPQVSKCPWTLRRVCSSWRQIALQEHRLWNRIRLNIPISSGYNNTFSVADYDYVQEILPPRGPLSISVNSVANSVRENIFHKIVVPHLSRITKLHFGAILPSSKFWSLPTESFSSIQDVSFTLSDVSPQPWQVHIFESAPHLRKLKINGLMGNQLIDTFLIPWSQLTHLNLDSASNSIHPHTIPRILSQCHSMESFKARVAYHGHEPGVSTPLIPMKDLSLPYLTIYWGPFDDYLNLGLPWAQLRDVTLNAYSGDSGAILSKLKAMIHVEALEISVMTGNGIYRNSVSSDIQFSHLRTLYLIDFGVPLLSNFVAPMLEKLTLSCGPEIDSDFYCRARHITSFLHRSGCSLKVFKYHMDFLDEDQNSIETFLVSLNLLQEWSAPSLRLSDNIMKNIGEAVLLPELRRFETFVESPDLFVDVVENRVEKIGSLLRKGFATLPTDEYFSARKTAAMERLERLVNLFSSDFYFSPY